MRKDYVRTFSSSYNRPMGNHGYGVATWLMVMSIFVLVLVGPALCEWALDMFLHSVGL